MEIRELRKAEMDFLQEMLYEAIYVAADAEAPPRSILFNEEIYLYIKDFGKEETDFCLVAVEQNELIGAAWVRKIQGYGYVDDETPELSMAIKPAFQGLGYGKLLLGKLLETLKQKNYWKVSLSVDNRNLAAMTLYLAYGFKLVVAKGYSEIMEKIL